MSRANARSIARVRSVAPWVDQSIVVANNANAWRSVCAAACSSVYSSGSWGESSTDRDWKGTGLSPQIATRPWRSASAYQSESGNSLFGSRAQPHPRAQDKTARLHHARSLSPWTGGTLAPRLPPGAESSRTGTRCCRSDSRARSCCGEARTLSALLFHPPPRRTAWYGLALACGVSTHTGVLRKAIARKEHCRKLWVSAPGGLSFAL